MLEAYSDAIDIHIPDSCRTGPSCLALRSAIATLYRLDDFYLEPVGSGFFSSVYKVNHRATGEIMALKMNTDVTNRSNALREIQLMNKLNHPNVLRFLGACVHSGCIHALTEYMNGGSLDEWIQDSSKSFVWSLRVKLAIDSAQGMSYLHSKNTFHRDLNPKNILIKVSNQTPTAIVADFGLADAIPDKAKRNGVRLPVKGTSWYLAPEILTNKWYDERADVFAYGITLCQLIARISSDPDILPRTQNYGIDYVAFSVLSGDCPPDFLQMAFKCCLVEPNSRPLFADVAHHLEDLERKLKARNDLMTGSSRRPRFVGHNANDERYGERKRSISVLQTRQRRLSTSLAYVDFLDVNVAQNRCVGEHMSRADPHYVPVASNPFPLLPEEYRGGMKKIVGYTSSLCPTVFEVPVLFRSPSTPDTLGSFFGARSWRVRSCPVSTSNSRHDFLLRPAAVRASDGCKTCYEFSSWHNHVVPKSGDSSGINLESNLPVDWEVDLDLDFEGTGSPDFETAYFNRLSDPNSFDSSYSPKGSSHSSNECSDLELTGLSFAKDGRHLPLIQISSAPDRTEINGDSEASEPFCDICVCPSSVNSVI